MEFDAALAEYLELVDPERVAELLRSVFEDPVVEQLILDDAEARGIEGDPQEILEAFLATISGGD